MTSDTEFAKVYEPAQVEERLYAHWRAQGYFQPATGDGPHFTVVLPPPNVTGRLHMGHALTATIEDTLVRWHRMRGFRALWLPGTDHAGIATQVMVERDLAKEGKTRQGIGREAFLERTWQWKEEHGGIIDRQHERLGASLDWSRYRFTMDEVSSRAVREAFVRLYEEGLIYRDYRLINWDYGSQTALSDLEVEHSEVDGKLWHLAYPVADSDSKERLVVATTRPETMLGDTAVAVHPEDERYRHLIGREVELPLTGRRIPIIADEILVKMGFGTGAVKVTPAHDANDFETGKRHELALIQVIDFDGKIQDPAPKKYVGMGVAEARVAVLADLEALGLLVETEDHKLAIGRSQRSGVIVEPLPSTQWYVEVGPLAKPALAAVQNGDTVIYPEHRTADYYRWLENIRDWCISRQLWWGHRIPAWHCRDCEQITVVREDPSACLHCGSAAIDQDEDVLDTWFSSGLWPLTCLGWPAEDSELPRFYPTSLMETGWDILFFWVARMMMFGIHFDKDHRVPFETVFLHSMVLGEDKQKMSKTKGNVVDPVELIDAFGADALRFYLCTMAGQDAGIVFSRARVEGYRNFCNKLWNAARFASMKLEGLDLPRWRAEILEGEDGLSRLSIADRWILGRALTLAADFAGKLDEWRLDLAAHAAYQFVWHELCDWYIELAKQRLSEDADAAERHATQGTLATVFDLVLRVLHPMIPFITEEIWQRLPRPADAGDSLMLAAWPMIGAAGERSAGPVVAAAAILADPRIAEAGDDVERLIAIVTSHRMLKAESKVSPAQPVDVLVRSDDPAVRASLARVAEAAAFVGRMKSLQVLGADPADALPKACAVAVVAGVEIGLPLAGLVDLGEEQKRLGKEIEKKQKELAALDKKLSNAGFVERAPAEVVDKERQRRAELADGLTKQQALLDRIR